MVPGKPDRMEGYQTLRLNQSSLIYLPREMKELMQAFHEKEYRIHLEGYGEFVLHEMEGDT